jgi:hypothetical protein
MVIADPNKGSYFYLEVKIDHFLSQRTDRYLDQKIENAIDIILSGMTANEDVYKFTNDYDKIIYLFATTQRKTSNGNKPSR